MKTRRAIRRAGFTLIELLVVVTIIAILAAIAFPATGAAIRAARRASTSAMCNQIATAVTAMNTEYGKWPTPSGGGSGDVEFNSTARWTELGIALNGNRRPSNNTTANSTINPRGIQFMSFKKKDLELTSNDYKDYPLSPFKDLTSETDRLYIVVVDTDYNNDIQVPDVRSGGADLQIGDGVAVYSKADDPSSKTKWVSSYK